MNKKILLLGLGFILLGSFSIYVFKIKGFPSGNGSVLRFILDAKIESMDPAKTYSNESLLISSQVLDQLYQYHYLKRPYELQPLLAEDFPQVLENGLLIKIKIKKNVFYHPHPALGDGPRELEADDFVMQFKRLAMLSLQSPGRGLFSGLISGFDEFTEIIGNDWSRLSTLSLKGVYSEDKYTLVIRLLKKDPSLIYYLSMNFISPVPWEVVKFYENKLDKIIVGTGPYILANFSDNLIELKKNPFYREEFYPTTGDRYANLEKLLDSGRERIPFIEKVEFHISSMEGDRWKSFFDKKVDMLFVPKTYLTKIFDQKGGVSSELKKNDVVLKHFPSLSNRWLSFNMRDPILGKNKYLRLAIAHAIDFSKYIQLISQNTSLQANSVIVPGVAGYSPGKEFKFNYDVNLAKEYLKKAGYTNPDKMPKIIYSTRGNNGINLEEADFIKKQLGEIGISVDIHVLTFTDFLKKGRAGELMFFTDLWSFDFPNAENILQLLVSSNAPGVNKSGYSNSKVDDLYDRLKETTNLDQRDRIINEIESIVMEDVPWIPLVYESSFIMHYPQLKNFRESNIIRNYVKYLKVENQ